MSQSRQLAPGPAPSSLQRIEPASSAITCIPMSSHSSPQNMVSGPSAASPHVLTPNLMSMHGASFLQPPIQRGYQQGQFVVVPSDRPLSFPSEGPPLQQNTHAKTGRGRKQTGPRSKKAKATPSSSIKRTLSGDDELTIIQYWKDNYELYCKSNKKAFAKKGAEDLNRAYFSKHQIDKTPITAEQLQYLLNFWTGKYKKVAKQFQDSGFGLTEKDPNTIKQVAEQKMKHFYEFHSFLACRANINPPVLFQTRQDNGNSVLEVDDAYGQLGVAVNPSNSGSNSGLDDLRGGPTGEESDEEHPRRASSVPPPKRRSREPRTSGTASRPRKRRQAESGAYVVNNMQSGSDEIAEAGSLVPSPGSTNPPRPSMRNIEPLPSVGRSDGEARNSSSRFKMVNDIYATQVTQIESQTETFAKTIQILENENTQRKKEVGLLEREQERLDREEERMVEEAKMRVDEANRKKVMMRRKMVMDEADQLRHQAAMYEKLNHSEKALACLEKVEALMVKLGKIGKDDTDASLIELDVDYTS